jgi:hypothetical protein
MCGFLALRCQLSTTDNLNLVRKGLIATLCVIWGQRAALNARRMSRRTVGTAWLKNLRKGSTAYDCWLLLAQNP